MEFGRNHFYKTNMGRNSGGKKGRVRLLKQNFEVGVNLFQEESTEIPELSVREECYRRGAFDSAKNHKRQRRKRQSVTAKREKSQTPKFV